MSQVAVGNERQVGITNQITVTLEESPSRRALWHVFLRAFSIDSGFVSHMPKRVAAWLSHVGPTPRFARAAAPGASWTGSRSLAPPSYVAQFPRDVSYLLGTHIQRRCNSGVLQSYRHNGHGHKSRARQVSPWRSPSVPGTVVSKAAVVDNGRPAVCGIVNSPIVQLRRVNVNSQPQKRREEQRST
jgi:hypothetical protein